MKPAPAKNGPRSSGHVGIAALVVAASLLTSALAAADDAPKIRLDRQHDPFDRTEGRDYQADDVGCSPMPSVPRVARFVRRWLAINQFLATSVECGEVNSRGVRQGWTYVFFLDKSGTDFERVGPRLLRYFGVTEVRFVEPGEAEAVRSESGEAAFVLIQLPGEDFPVRVGTTGDARLDVAVEAEGVEALGITATATSSRNPSAVCRARHRLSLEPTPSRDDPWLDLPCGS